MDTDQLRRAALASREFPVTGPGTISAILRRPSRYEVQLALQRSGGDDDAARLITLERLVLTNAVVAWSGVRLLDILPDHPDPTEQLPYEPGAVALYLDAQPDVAQAWGLALFEQMRLSRERESGAEKN